MYKNSFKKFLSFIFSTSIFLSVCSCAGPNNPSESSQQSQSGSESSSTSSTSQIIPIEGEDIPYLVNSDQQIVFGNSHQKWYFNKNSDKWLFKGISVGANDSGDDLVFYGSNGKLDDEGQIDNSGNYFVVTAPVDSKGIGNEIDGFIRNINVVLNTPDLIVLKLEGNGFTSTLTSSSDSKFIERAISINPSKDYDIFLNEINFSFKTQVDTCSEKGFILSHLDEDTAYTLPYSFPGFISKITDEENERMFSIANVVDYNNTADNFRYIRRKQTLNGYFDLGSISQESTMTGGKTYSYIENVFIQEGEVSFYDMIYACKQKYDSICPLDVEALASANGNMTVSSWDEACKGAINDILDSRGRPCGDESVWGPYGYNNGSSEAIGSMVILKGTIRYALATHDDELLAQMTKYLKNFITPDSNGKCYIMPLSKYNSKYSSYNYFYRSGGNGAFNPLDPSYTDQGDVFGSFKYYGRVSRFGELAILLDDDDLKNAYLSLMPLLLQFKGPNYEQDIQWNFDGTPSNYDYHDGGSSGSEAMWAYCMYFAYQIAQTQKEKDMYWKHMMGSLDAANKQDFDRTSALRDFPKPESLSYLTKMNLVAYEATGDISYLNYALLNSRAIYFYYFQNTHPYTYFQTFGFGYACSKERWEAFWEMVETLILALPILKYEQDPLLLDMLYAMKTSVLWTLPINGYPEGNLGGHSDWLDALYIPFEQPTAVMGDNTTSSGGGSSYLRHSKELYGIGELFNAAISFETLGKTSSEKVILVNYEADNCLDMDFVEYNYICWNVSSDDIGTSLIFNHLSSENYELYIDNSFIGCFTAEQLASGIQYTAPSRMVSKIKLKETDQTTNISNSEVQTLVEIGNVSSSSVDVSMENSNVDHYIVETSLSDAFISTLTNVKYVNDNKATIYHQSNSSYYLRVTAVDTNGNCYLPFITKIDALKAYIGVIEDFDYSNPVGEQKGDSIGSWEATAENYDGKIRLITDSNDFTMTEKYGGLSKGYMAVYKPAYQGEDVDTFQNVYHVDLTNFPIFEVYPYSKNVGAKFSLYLIIDGIEKCVIDHVEGFDQVCYRANLNALFGVSGEHDVKIKIVSEGKNRGFSISQMRFFNETQHDNTYAISNLNYTTLGCNVDNNPYLQITNNSSMPDVYNDRFTIGEVDMSQYNSLDVTYKGITFENSGLVNCSVEIYKEGKDTPSASSKQTLKQDGTISLDLSSVQGKGTYYVKVLMTDRITQERVTEVYPTLINLNSEIVVSHSDVAVDDGDKKVLNGWNSNWAYANPDDGYIYVGRDDPSQPYGSIYKDNIVVDLDESPVIRFTISDIKGQFGGDRVRYTLKINDGNMSQDLALLQETTKTGTFEVNLRLVLGIGGTSKFRFDFYIVAPYGTEYGVKFDSFEFLKGKTIYENNNTNEQSKSTSESFVVNLNQTPYIYVDIAELTYGESALMYVEYNEQTYELKTRYEDVFGKMYTREKVGAFRYDLRDILPIKEGNAELKLVIVVTGLNSEIFIRNIYLSDNNEVPLINHISFIR